MKEELIQTDTFVVKKHKLRIYRITEHGTGILLWTSEQQAIRYIQRRHIQKLLIKRKGQF